MKIVFFGTSSYSLPLLECLQKNFDLSLVITAPNRPVGRKQTLSPSAVSSWADAHKIPKLTPSTLKKDTPDREMVMTRLREITSDLALVADYGLIIPEGIFQFPKLGTLNIHFGKLPALRGPSPVQFTLLSSCATAWVTIFKLDNPPDLTLKMDSGPILWQKEYPIEPTATAQTLYESLFQRVATELPQILSDYLLTDRLISQDHSGATFTRFLTRDDGFIAYETLIKAIQNQPLSISELPKIQQEAREITHTVSTATSRTIYDFYRAVTPWPGMWTTVVPKGQTKERRLKIITCHPTNDKLALDQIQFEGEIPKPAHSLTPLLDI